MFTSYSSVLGPCIPFWADSGASEFEVNVRQFSCHHHHARNLRENDVPYQPGMGHAQHRACQILSERLGCTSTFG